MTSHPRAPLIAWLIAEVCSLGGTRLSMVAVPWLVLTSTGSATLTGVVAFAEMLPYVLAKAFAGPLVDRLGSRRIAVVCDLVSMIVIGAVPVLYLAGWLHFVALVIIVALGGLFRGPSDGAKGSAVPALAAHAGIKLERVTGMQSTIERLATTVGTAVAGGLVALVGPALALAFNAGTFGLAAILIGFGLSGLRPQPVRAAGSTGEKKSYLTELSDGWTFLRRDAVLLIIAIMVAGTNFADQALSSVFMPVWVRDHGYGAATLGLSFATMSAASVIGAILATALGPRLPRLAVYAVAFLVCSLPRFAVLALFPQLPIVLAVMAVAGFAAGFINPILSAVIFERIPGQLTGRVSTLVNSLAWSLIPLGGLVGGLSVTGLGLNPSLIIFGSAYLMLTLLPLFVPVFRQFNDRPGSKQEGRDPRSSRAALARPT